MISNLRSALFTLAFTIVVEGVVLGAIQRRDVWRIVRAVVAINAFTQPLALFAYQLVGIGLWPAEVVVIAVEGALLAALLVVPLLRGYLLAVAANLASALMGLTLVRIFFR